MPRTELAVVGAGPAGMAAAEVARRLGLDVTVIDEQQAPGGQIYRQPPAEFQMPDWLRGRHYRAGKALVRRVSADPAIRRLMGTTVAAILDGASAGAEGGFALLLANGAGMRKLMADAVLVAPGCYDMPVVFPGWDLPGVMAAGGIQAFVKSQRLIPGDRFVFAGTHPLQLVVADQLVAAGADVAGVYFAQSRARAIEALKAPAVLVEHAGKFAQAAASWWRLRRARVPVRFGCTVVQAHGKDTLRSVTVARVAADGTVCRDESVDVDCDRLGVCFGFLATSELARQAGAASEWDAARGGWIVRHDQWMHSSVPGIYVAGEVTGVAGAEVAAEEGRLAAVGCALAAGRISAARATSLARPIRRKLARSNRFARLLSQLSWPGHGLLDQLRAQDAILCRCEEVSVGDFVTQLEAYSLVGSANAAKLLTRTGMGYCQGRYCQHSVMRVLASHLGVPEAEVGAFAARFPVRPLAIAELVEVDRNSGD